MTATHRVLAVADWRTDPGVVVDALAAESRREPAAFGLLVPATLSGLTWVGDPTASRPCAERQVAALQRLAQQRGLIVETATVGDPEPVAATVAALELWDADRVELFGPRAPQAARRVQRRTGLPVKPIVVAPPVRRRTRRSLRGLAALWRPQCEIS